jgi:hypothetical protein
MTRRTQPSGSIVRDNTEASRMSREPRASRRTKPHSRVNGPPAFAQIQAPETLGEVLARYTRRPEHKSLAGWL